MMTTILIVESHDFLCQMLHRWLSALFSECHIIGTTNEADAIALAPVDLPHAIVIDIGLPGNGSLEAVKRIKSALPNTPVVVLTSYGDEIHRIHAIEQGANAYIGKDAMPSELPSTLEVLLLPQNEPNGHKPDLESTRVTRWQKP
jgi:DNA-binding NarL/FixJ family response regulator